MLHPRVLAVGLGDRQARMHEQLETNRVDDILPVSFSPVALPYL